jgi:hypothetical protein
MGWDGKEEKTPARHYWRVGANFFNMSIEEGLEIEWEIEPVKPDLDSLQKHAFPFRQDPKEEERRKMCEPARSRRFECPRCGILKNVEPTFSGLEWHYFGQCSHCGAKWCNAYRLMIKCEDCGKRNPVTSKNPDGKCRCNEEVARPF